MEGQVNLSENTAAASRTFWNYWTAYSTSTVGSAITAVALPLTAVQVLHADEFQTGLLAAAAHIAWLVIGLPAGAIVQRLPLRGAQVWTDVIRFLAILSVPVLWWMQMLTLGQLVLVALVISFADVIFFVASATFIPKVVPKEQLQGKNSLMSGTHAVAQLGGPSLGGILVQLFGPVLTMLIDALSYLISAILLRSMPETERSSAAARSSIRTEIKEGLRFTLSDSVMRSTLWNATIINFVGGAQLALFAIYLIRELHAPAVLVGILLAMEGVGALLGASLSSVLARTICSARACLLASALLVVGAFITPMGQGYAGMASFAIGSLLFAAGTAITSTTTRTYRQLVTPPELLSRVMGSVRFISWGAVPVGSLAAGALGAVLGSRETLFAVAFVGAASLLVLIFSPVGKLRDFPDQPAVRTPAGAAK